MFAAQYHIHMAICGSAICNSTGHCWRWLSKRVVQSATLRFTTMLAWRLFVLALARTELVLCSSTLRCLRSLNKRVWRDCQA